MSGNVGTLFFKEKETFFKMFVLDKKCKHNFLFFMEKRSFTFKTQLAALKNANLLFEILEAT